MRQYIGRGLSPASAMRATWADVRRGSVARPPRGKRRTHRWAGSRGIRVPANVPPPVSRVGQLVAQAYQRSGVHSLARLEMIADAYAQAYRAPRGDVYESARRWLGRRELRNPRRSVIASCRCADPGCPVHPGRSTCPHAARTTIYRSDMADRSGTRMCEGCAADALSSGVFHTRNPLTRAETRRVLIAARDDMRASRRLPSLTASGRQDPRVVERHRGWWRGRADGLLGVAHDLGRLGARRRVRPAGRRGIGPGLNPGSQRTYYVTITVEGARSPVASYGPYTREEAERAADRRRDEIKRIGSTHIVRIIDRSSRPRENPRAVLIYDRVLKIFARKQRGPHRGQAFVHNYRTGPRMLGLPNGDLLITDG